MVCTSGRIMLLPKKRNNSGKPPIKNKLSRTMVYNTMVAVFAVDNFSWANTKKATADPPTLVGETAELNSQMKMSSMHLRHLNSLSDRMRRRVAYERCLIISISTLALTQNSVCPVQFILANSACSNCSQSRYPTVTIPIRTGRMIRDTLIDLSAS